jgi:hypothetical protein
MGNYTHSFQLLDTTEDVKGNYGFYLIADQELQDPEIRSVRISGQADYTIKKILIPGTPVEE